jgi:hypothetical protein
MFIIVLSLNKEAFFGHIEILQTMGPPIKIFIPLDSKWIGCTKFLNPWCKSYWILILSLKIQWNQNKKFGAIGVCSWYCWKALNVKYIKSWTFLEIM